MNKKIAAMVAAAALAAMLGLVGCGGSQPASSSAAPESSSAAVAESSSAAAESSSAAAESSSAASSAAAPAASSAAQGSYIGEDAAKEAALKDAGYAAADVTELEAELDQDDPTVHYDVDFKADGMEYDYDIDATTGAVLTSNAEYDD